MSSSIQQDAILSEQPLGLSTAPIHKHEPPNGVGIVHKGFIYGFLNDSPEGRQFEALVQRQREGREVVLEEIFFKRQFGEKKGKVMWNTRRQTADGQGAVRV